MTGGGRGTRERKRLRRAVPGALSSGLASGCIWAVVTYAAVCLVLYRQTGWLGWVLLAAPALILSLIAFVRALYAIGLLMMARLTLGRRGQRCVVVYSRSPIWESHVVSEWLPRFGDVAAPLNWSDRTAWGFSVEALLFKRFCLASVNFNPAVIVLRGLRRPLVFRFFYAFHEAKQGRTEYLALLEGQMFGALGLDSPTRPNQPLQPTSGAGG